MKQEEKLKKLTQKYFLQQKVREVGLGFLLLIMIISFPYMVGNSFGDGLDIMCGDEVNEIEECKGYQTWLEGLWYVIISLGILLIIYLIGRLWIESNWEKAELKAEIELEKRGSRK